MASLSANEPGSADSSQPEPPSAKKISYPALALVVIAGLLPWQGRLGLLKTIIPLLIVVYIHRRRRRSLAEIGLPRPNRPLRLFFWALAFTAGAYIFELFLLNPLADALTPAPKDLTLFEPIQDNFAMLAMYLAFMWVFAAFGEEFIWRGFLMTELANALGSSKKAWAIALLLSSVIFGFLHLYQGPRGVLSASVSGLIMGGIFLWDGKRLWLPILVHGLGNTFSFFLIFLGYYKG